MPTPPSEKQSTPKKTRRLDVGRVCSLAFFTASMRVSEMKIRALCLYGDRRRQAVLEAGCRLSVRASAAFTAAIAPQQADDIRPC
jgi:hypothetical protein